MSRVRIGTCANPTEGAFVRSMLGARGIPCVIGAEHHASLLGPIGAAFLTLDIWVDAEDAEDATALLRDVRDTKLDDVPDEPDAPDAPDDDDGAWVARAHAMQTTEDAELDTVRDRAFHKRRAIVGLLSGVFLTFGTAHLFTGAPGRGLALAAIELLGVLHYQAGHALGAVAVAAAIVADVGGSAWRLWREAKSDVLR